MVHKAMKATVDTERDAIVVAQVLIENGVYFSYRSITSSCHEFKFSSEENGIDFDLMSAAVDSIVIEPEEDE